MKAKTVAPNIQDLFRVTREEWIESARVAARNLLELRATITIEDVLEIVPRPNYLHPNTTGQVFRGDMFRSVGFAPSRRAISNGRYVRIWKLSKQYERSVEQDCEG